MFKYICKRLLYIVLTLFVILTATFFLMNKLPGTPFDDERFSMLPPEEQAIVMEKYGLDEPVYMQYIKYVKNILKGNFGESFIYTGQDVSNVLVHRIGPSALIGAQAVLLGLSVGLILGILAAWKHNTGIDYFTMIVAVLGVSVPNFVLAALLQYFVGLKWGVLPVAFWESWSSSILPSIALSVSVIAMIARFIRTEMLDVLEQDYIVTAKAKGLSKLKVLMTHAVRNSIIPVITILGPIIVNIFTGSLAVENIYGIPGIGSLFVDSIKMNDYSTIMAIAICYSAFYVLVILVTDVLYSLIDPRIRLISNRAE